MKNYVISLKNATNRREHIICEFGKQNIAFEFFDAITPNDIDDLSQKFALNLNNAPLANGEKACLLSHVCLWQKMLDNDLDYIAIFEDDVYLGENAHLFFDNDNWLKEHHLDFVKTETFLQAKKLDKSPIHIMDNRQVYRLQEYHLGTAGYIISQKAAQHLLAFIKSLKDNEIIAIDNLMFDKFLSHNDLPIYQLYPAICVQEFILYPNQNHMPSDIEAMRIAQKKQRPKRSLMAKIKGELSNAHRKTFGQLSRTKIIFR